MLTGLSRCGLLRDGAELLAGLDGTEGGLDGGEVVGVGDDDHGGRGLACGLDGGKVGLDEELTSLDAVELLHMRGEGRAAELNGVDADVDEDLDAVVGHEADGVLGVEEHADHAGDGGVDRAVGGQDHGAVADGE